MVALNHLVLPAHRGAVRVLTMNRPEARNALNIDLISALHAALIDADRDASVRAVVLTGADPAFCAGLDLKQVQRDGSAYFERLHAENCITKVAQLSKPVLGATNGPAITGGMEMALGCDFLVASDRAVFGDTHARVGILPGAGMTARLLDRTIELATQICAVAAPVMQGLKAIYVAGAAAIVDPALAAEQAV